MADIELPAKDAPDYKEKLSEKRRALMAITRQKKKDNADVKKENHRQQVEQNKINRQKDKELFKEFKKMKEQADDKKSIEIVNEDNEEEHEVEEEEEKEEEVIVKPKKVIKEKPKPKPKVKKQVIIEESESESEEEEEEVIIVKKKREPKKKEPKVIYVEREPKPPPIRRQPRPPPIQEEYEEKRPTKIDYSKYFTLR